MTDHEHYVRLGPEGGTHQRSVRSGVATVSGRGLQLVLQLGLAMVFARLLTPEDFGVQAMVFPVALLVNSIANGGVQSAIIQRDDLDHTQASALFWTALRWNAGLCGLMALTVPILALSFDEPRVLGIGIAWACVILGATLSSVPEALLKRQLRFATVVRAHLAALVLSILAGVAAALLGARHWSFMVQIGVLEFGRVGIIWMVSAWRPARRSANAADRREASSGLQRYWRGLAGARALGWVGDHSDRMTVAVIGGAPMLGLYDGAKRWGTFAFLELYLSLSEVAVASLSRVRHDGAMFARYVQNAFLPVLAVSLPIVAFMFVEARGVLGLLLGDQWLEASTLLRVLCVSTAFVSLTRLAQWIQLSTGATHRQLKWALVTTPALLAGVLVGARYGPLGVAIGLATANAATSVPSLAYAVRGTTLRLGPILATWVVPLVASIVAAAALVWVGGLLPSADHFVGLVSRACAFFLVYALGWLAIPGGVAMLRALRSQQRSAATPMTGGEA